MAIIHQAELHPTKMELLETWLPGQPWFRGAETADPGKLGAFRFDDPAGEVGIETLLVEAGGSVYQVPLTYRGAPLAGTEPFLVGTMEHSVLGPRWVYDACGDPIYAAALASALLAGTPQAGQFLDVGGKFEPLPESVSVQTTGPKRPVPPTEGLPSDGPVEASNTADGTLIRAGGLQMLLVRRLDQQDSAAAGPSLTASWAGQTAPVTLARLTSP